MMSKSLRQNSDKLCSMHDAIKQSVFNGSSINIEGFTHLICFSAGHEIIRQKIKNLVAIRLTPDLVYDQLIEAGCVKKIVFSWAGNPGVGSLHGLRRRTETQDPTMRLELEEYSHFGMVARFLAGSAGLPFWVVDHYAGSDFHTHQKAIKTIQCPYTGKTFHTVPALHPDVTIVHVQRSDIQGNAQVWGLMGTQREAAFSAKKVIVVAEEIVSTEHIRSDPNRTLIPGIIVDHVVHDPWGCHPSYAQGFYDRDNDFYVSWDDISRDPKTYANYLEEFVYGVKDRAHYLKKCDSNLMKKLKAKSKLSQGVDYGY